VGIERFFFLFFLFLIIKVKVKVEILKIAEIFLGRFFRCRLFRNFFCWSF
jgi:hypothetical protein